MKPNLSRVDILSLSLLVAGILILIGGIVAQTLQPFPSRIFQVDYVSTTLTLAFYIWTLAGIIWVVDTLSLVRRRLKTNSPQEIVKTRYARGEITKEQLDQILRELQDNQVK